MKENFRETLKLLKDGGKLIFFFELIYKVIFVIMILPLSGFLFDSSIKVAGYSYLTNDNVKGYITNPLVWLLLLIIIVINIIYAMGELCTLCVCLEAARQHVFPRMKLIFLTGIRKAIGILIPKNAGFLFFMLFFIPCSNISFWTGAATLFNLPSGTITGILKNPTALTIIAVCVIVLFLLTMSTVFSVELYTLQKLRFINSIKGSLDVNKKHFWYTVGHWIVWNLFIILGILFAYFIAISLIVIGILLFNVEAKLQLAVFLSYFRGINILFIPLSGMASVVLNTALLTKLFSRYTYKQIENSGSQIVELIAPREGRSKRKLAVRISVIAIILLNGVYAYRVLTNATVNYIEQLAVPQITSHRGNSAAAPENTMRAVEFASRDLSDCAEIDVQQTKDGKLVIIHDSNFKRTTGLDKNVWETNYDEIKDLDAGFWFDPKIQDAKIPTLDEVLKYCKGKMKLNIEIKGYEHSQWIEKEVVKAIEKHDMVDDCYITSFNYNSLRLVKNENKDIKTGYIISASYGSFYNMKYADFFSIRATTVTRDMVKQIHNVGKEIHVWTVNGKIGIKDMMDLGVDNIITDNPVTAREVIYGDITVPKFAQMIRFILD